MSGKGWARFGAGLSFGLALLFLLLPVRVQSGNPIERQVDANVEAGTYSCGSALTWIGGDRRWEGDDTQLYVYNSYLKPPFVCPGRVRSNATSAAFCAVLGVGVVVLRRRFTRRRAVPTAA